MNRILTILFLFAHFISFGQGGFAPTGNLRSTGNYPITWGNENKGGWHTVYDTIARNAIPSNFRDTAMVVACYKDSTIWRLLGGISNSNWVPFVTSGGNASNADSLGHIPASGYIKNDTTIVQNGGFNINGSATSGEVRTDSVYVNKLSNRPPFFGLGTPVAVFTADTTAELPGTVIGLDTYFGKAANIFFRKSFGTPQSLLPIPKGNALMHFDVQGYAGGSDPISGPWSFTRPLTVTATENFSPTGWGNKLLFRCVPNGTTNNSTNNLVWNQNAGLYINYGGNYEDTVSTDEKLSVNGKVITTGTDRYFSNIRNQFTDLTKPDIGYTDSIYLNKVTGGTVTGPLTLTDNLIVNSLLFLQGTGPSLNPPRQDSILTVDGGGTVHYENANVFAPATSGTSVLSGNGTGGFSNVTIGSGLTFSAGTLSSSGSVDSTKYVLHSGDTISYLGLTTQSVAPTAVAGQTRFFRGTEGGISWKHPNGGINTLISSGTLTGHDTTYLPTRKDTLALRGDTSKINQTNLVTQSQANNNYVPVFIMAGESNAAGAVPPSYLVAGDTANPYPLVRILNNTSLVLESLRIGSNGNNNILVNEPGMFGWELALAKKAASHSFFKDTIYLVKIGYGAANITQLQGFKDTATKRITAAYNQIYAMGKCPLPIVLYSQGINGGTADTAAWLRDTRTYWAFLRSQLGNAPMLITKLIGGGAGLNHTIDIISFSDRLSYAIDTTGAPFQAGSPNHWDRAGDSVLVERMSNIVNTYYYTATAQQTQANDINNRYWSLYGNYNIASNQYLGTNDNTNLLFKVNNMNAGLIANSSSNTAIGVLSANVITTGTGNTALGYSALGQDTSGAFNTAIGRQALGGLKSGINNVAMGYLSGANTIGNNNTSIGTSSLQSNSTGSGNFAGGYNALLSNSGSLNVGILGITSGTGSGSFNVGIGAISIDQLTSGMGNAGVGYASLTNNTTGNYNVGVGYQAGYNGSVALNSNTQCSFLGYQSNSSVNGITNSTAIGSQAQVAASNQVVIGNTSVTNTVLRGRLNVGGGTFIPKDSLPRIITQSTNQLVFVDTATNQMKRGGDSVLYPTLDTRYFAQGGNSYGTDLNIGTNDANGVVIKTNGINWVKVDASGSLLGGNVTTGNWKIDNTGSARFNGAITTSVGTTTITPIIIPKATSLNTTPVSGGIEFDSTHFYGSIKTTRYQLEQLSGSYSQSVSAINTVTVTIGSTQANNTYKINVTPTSALAAVLFYVTNKTTTTFDVTYIGAPITGTLSFDYSLFP